MTGDIDIQAIALDLLVDVRTLPALERPLEPQVHETRLLTSPPWVRPLGRLALEVTTQGWKFPTPPEATAPTVRERPALRIAPHTLPEGAPQPAEALPPRTRLV